MKIDISVQMLSGLLKKAAKHILNVTPSNWTDSELTMLREIAPHIDKIVVDPDLKEESPGVSPSTIEVVFNRARVICDSEDYRVDRKIHFIKELRTQFPFLSLKDAKEIIEGVCYYRHCGCVPGMNWTPIPKKPDIDHIARQLVLACKCNHQCKIACIKSLRAIIDCGLIEAKNAIDRAWVTW
jgi:ribosomal protein L7/L12